MLKKQSARCTLQCDQRSRQMTMQSRQAQAVRLNALCSRLKRGSNAVQILHTRFGKKLYLFLCANRKIDSASESCDRLRN